MNYYDILFAKYLNKGEGGGGGSLKNPKITVTIKNNSSSSVTLFTSYGLFYLNEEGEIEGYSWSIEGEKAIELYVEKNDDEYYFDPNNNIEKPPGVNMETPTTVNCQYNGGEVIIDDGADEAEITFVFTDGVSPK